MPKRQENVKDGKSKKPQESSDLTIELQTKNNSFCARNRESSEEEEGRMSNLNNLIDAARIVEGNESPELPKKGKAKAQRKKEPSKLKRKGRGSKSDKAATSKAKDAEKFILKSDSNSEDSDSERENEIASLKSTMTMMMAKLEKLESSKRKRKNKKPKKQVQLSSDDENTDYIKPNKLPKKESELKMKSKSLSENALSVTPDYGMPNMNNMFQYQQMMLMQQQMMYNPAAHPSFVFPSMLHMMQRGGINTPISSSVPLPTNAISQKKTSASNTPENSNQSPADKLESPNSKTERKKQEKESPARSSVEKDLSRDGGESDASEVYEPSMKDGTFEKYLSAQSQPTKSFLGFIEAMNKEENQSIQSRVVSSTKRNSETSKSKKSNHEDKKQGIEKPENKSEPELPPSSNIAGILMNLMPNQNTNNVTKEDTDSKDRPQINNTLKSLFGYAFESNAMNKAAENIMAKQNKLDSHTPYKFDHHPSSVPDRPPETKRYVDNTEWMRDSIRNLYLQDQDGDTILHILIAKEEEAMAIDVVKRMKGFKLDILNALGQTPLHLAMYTKNIKVIQTLLQHGADISIVDAHGNSPVHIACEENSLQMLRVLFEYQLVNREGYDKIMQIRNNQGMAAIHIATNQGNLPILKFLAAQNVDLDIQESRSGNTPLLMALGKSNWRLAEFFMNSNCNVNIPNFSNNYPLHLAVQGNSMDMVKALLSRGAEAGSKANEYENGEGSSEIKLLLAKEMRKRRRHRKNQDN